MIETPLRSDTADQSAKNGHQTVARRPAERRKAAPSAKPARQIDPFEMLWGMFTSTGLALALILAIAVACLAGTLIAQMPSEMLRSNDAVRVWVERIRPRYGPLTDLFQTLGLFSVFATGWFRALLGLLAINIVICTANRLPGIWRQVFGAPTWPKEAVFERGEPRRTVQLTGASLEAARATVGALMRRGHYRLVEQPESDGQVFYADRFRLARFGTIITHLSLIIVLTVPVLGGWLGFFEESGFAVPIGSTKDVGHGTGLVVGVDDFADEYYPDGRPSDYRSDLVLYDGGREVARQTIRVNEPLIYNGVRFHQSYYGQSVVIDVADAQDGKPLYSGAVPLTYRSSDGQRPLGYFFLASRDLHVYLIGTAGRDDTMIRPGELAVEAYRGASGLPTVRAALTQRQPVPVSGLQVTFEREIPFTGMRVVRDPGADVVWVASVLLVLGVAMAFYFPHRKLWLRLRPAAAGTEVVLVGAGRQLAREIERLADRLAPDQAVEREQGDPGSKPAQDSVAGRKRRSERSRSSQPIVAAMGQGPRGARNGH